ncbi:5'-AMP-activated protein kinase subunit gamma-2 [Dissostichus eleginoides]|uniref:5'-AMP-activated protein kinase subunit gamma-2 n=1 Tax=Dissostichus eleginoides TaxID=100907 RepID=A0AAD9BAR5_DISEL|nr:5'-AMP-activated protein kinase subunit gamma-2 [Dissostichus eleginoides]
MGSTVMESSKDSSKKMPKKKKSLRINMPDFGAFTSPQVETSDSTKSGAKTAERQIHSASPTKGESVRSPATLPLHSHSAPVPVRTSSGSPKTIFPYPSYQDSPPKSPRRLSFSGIFRSSSSSTPPIIKIFSRTRKGEWKS